MQRDPVTVKAFSPFFVELGMWVWQHKNKGGLGRKTENKEKYFGMVGVCLLNAQVEKVLVLYTRLLLWSQSWPAVSHSRLNSTQGWRKCLFCSQLSTPFSLNWHFPLWFPYFAFWGSGGNALGQSKALSKQPSFTTDGQNILKRVGEDRQKGVEQATWEAGAGRDLW